MRLSFRRGGCVKSEDRRCDETQVESAQRREQVMLATLAPLVVGVLDGLGSKSVFLLIHDFSLTAGDGTAC